MEMLSRMKFWMTGVVVLLISNVASANVGLPIAIMLWPISILLFIPIVYVEAYVLQERLLVKFDKALSLAFWANLVSSLAGVVLYLLIGIPYFL